MSRPRIPFPWLSLCAALIIMLWQLALANPDWIRPWVIPQTITGTEYVLSAIGVWVIALTFDLQRFLRARVHYREELEQHQDQIAELFESRRQLGTRARTYSSHADKLKLFISDKLLEYIEYDEKFLHFKNIASEVRHNGVISYDRAQTALKHAAEICADRLDDPAQGRQFEEAASALTYLWDLLDIATTDNIALHVANRIYDSEEYYFQAQLNKDDPELVPYSPTFSMFGVLHKALLPLVEEPDDFRNTALPEFPLRYAERRFELLATGDSDLLGNPNHMVLLLENLLNNAFYYAEQKSSKTRYSRVKILLARQWGKEGDEILLEVYNRGPRIKEEDRDRIFQLGYSSRRIRDHHGKGLGLYFVNEICKGFEGGIEFENIDNRESSLSLRVALVNGEVETHFVNLVVVNGKALCRSADDGEDNARSREWSFSAPIASIEVGSKGKAEPQVIDDLSGREHWSQADSAEPLLPRWSIEGHNRRRSARLVFRPVDVRGVRFRLHLPTAISRLEGQDSLFEN